MLPLSQWAGNAFVVPSEEPEDDVMPPLRLQPLRRRALREQMRRIRREMGIDRRSLARAGKKAKPILPKWKPWPAPRPAAMPKRTYRHRAPVILTEQGDPAVNAAILEMLLEHREGASA